MMNEHTQGPWYVEKGGERPINTIACIVSAPDDLGPVAFVTKVNAPLVAQAPDMYNELQLLRPAAELAYQVFCEMIESYDADSGPPPNDLMDAHTALFIALAKAPAPELSDDGADLPF